jgi:hypothetical protein
VRLALTLFSRPGCHLCEIMLEQLQPFLEKYPLELQLVDIDSDDELLRRYALKIPVLALEGETLCQYQLDPEVLSQALKSCSEA